MKLPHRFLCVITDERPDPVDLAALALEGGATMLQLRNKWASGRELFEWALRIQELCRKHDALFILNDRVDIAMAMHADGVHLGQNDLPAGVARQLLGPDAVIGVSVSNNEEAVKAKRDGASYLGLGHIYPTGSKEKNTPPIGLTAITAVRKVTELPLVAIGGIDEINAPQVVRAGASGIAVISAVTGSDNPLTATKALIRSIWQ